MAENFLLSDKCTTCGCPDFYADEPDRYSEQTDTWLKIHDQKISNSAKTFTFSADAVSAGSTYAKPEHLSREGIFKVTAYPVTARPSGVGWADDCVWKSGGVTLDNSFARDQSGDNIGPPVSALGLRRATGERFPKDIRGQISMDGKVLKSWGWGFEEGEGTYSAHYRASAGITHNDVYASYYYGLKKVGAIFVYLDKTKTSFGEIPDFLKTSDAGDGAYTSGGPNRHHNPHNVRPHFNRHFIDWTEGDTITGQIDSVSDGTTTGGVDLRATEWVVELWSLQTTPPAEKYGMGGHYLLTNDYPDKRISAIRWRRWTASGINNYWIDVSGWLNNTTKPVGNWFWPLWTYEVDLPRSVGSTGCSNELLRFAAFESGAPFPPSAPWGWFPEDEYFNPTSTFASIQYGGSSFQNHPNNLGGVDVAATGNLTFGTGGSCPSVTTSAATTFPSIMSAGGGNGLVRPNLKPWTGASYRLKGRGGLWPLLTAQPLFDDGSEGDEMRIGAGGVGGIRYFAAASPSGYSRAGDAGLGCNAHYPSGNNPRIGGPWGSPVVEGIHQHQLTTANWLGAGTNLYSTGRYATCWQLDFSPTHPENRQADSYETCVRADGAFFHQDPLHANYGCP